MCEKEKMGGDEGCCSNVLKYLIPNFKEKKTIPYCTTHVQHPIDRVLAN